VKRGNGRGRPARYITLIPNTVATPVISPVPGTYQDAQLVTITCKTIGATIYYTTDGTDPTRESTEYTEPISVEVSTTVKAKAFMDSAVASAELVIFNPITECTWVGADAIGTRDGTFDNPYESLRIVDDIATALEGNKAIIYVKAGTYQATGTSSLHKLTKGYTWRTYGGDVILQTTAGNNVLIVAGETVFSMDGFTFDSRGSEGTAYNLMLGITGGNCKNKTFTNCKFINPKTTMITDLNEAVVNDNIVFNFCTFTGTCNYLADLRKSTAQLTFNSCTLAHVPRAAPACSFKAAATTGDKIQLTLNNCTISLAGLFLRIGKKGVYTFYKNTITHVADFTEANYGLFHLDSAVGDSADTPEDDNALIFNENIVNGSTYTYGASDSGYILLNGTDKIYLTVTAKRNNITFNNDSIERAFIRANNMLNYDVTDNSVYMLDTSPVNTWSGLIRAGYNRTYKKCESCEIARNYIYSPVRISGAMIKWGVEALVWDSDVVETREVIRDVQDGAYIHDNYLVGAGNKTVMIGEVERGNGVHSIFCGFNKNNKVYYNKLVGCGSMAAKGSGADNEYTEGGFRNNVLIDCYDSIITEGVSLTIANNTVIVTSDLLRALVLAYAIPDAQAETPADPHTPTITLYNNILIAAQHDGNPIVKIQTGDGTGNYPAGSKETILVSDNNAILTGGNYLAKQLVAVTTSYDFETWQDLEGQSNDQASFDDASGVDTGTGIPSESSNVLGAGVDLTEAGQDYEKGLNITSVFPTAVVLKDQDEDWDIGAYVR
jgi:hypothetical protein